MTPRSMRSAILATALVVIIATATGFALRLAYQRGFGAALQQAQFKRGGVIFQQAAKQPRDGVVVLGDSNVELQRFTTLCGRPVLNAGISGVTTGPLARPVEGILRHARPAIVVVAVGVNDAAAARTTPFDTWQADYRALLRSVRAKHVIVMGIPPIEPGQRWSRNFDQAMIDRQNAALPALAAAAGAHFVRPLASTRGLTFDGVHLTVRGDALWQAAVETACPA